jgi:subtilisin family serine protease
MKKISITAMVFILSSVLFAGCSSHNHATTATNHNHERHKNHQNHSENTLKTIDQPEVVQQEIKNSLHQWYRKNIYGKGVKIAILDTGIDKTNKDLVYVKGINFISEKTDEFDDENGHGTKIAGIIGARKNNYNLLGIAPESDLYIAKVADENGNVKFENLIKGINWAIEQNVDIINISLEFQKDNPQLHKAIKKAVENNIIVIASSGNIKYPGDTDNAYPGSYPEVISVGMLNTKGKIYSKEFEKKKVDVFAPGEDIISLYFNNKMTLDTGVSFATAYTSGYCALLIQKHKMDGDNYNKEKIKRELKKNLENNL